MTDLGWLNQGGETAQKIDVAEAECRAAGHKRKSYDNGPAMRGMDHIVECGTCDYLYHWDSSD